MSIRSPARPPATADAVKLIRAQAERELLRRVLVAPLLSAHRPRRDYPSIYERLEPAHTVREMFRL